MSTGVQSTLAKSVPSAFVNYLSQDSSKRDRVTQFDQSVQGLCDRTREALLDRYAARLRRLICDQSNSQTVTEYSSLLLDLSESKNQLTSFLKAIWCHGTLQAIQVNDRLSKRAAEELTYEWTKSSAQITGRLRAIKSIATAEFVSQNKDCLPQVFLKNCEEQIDDTAVEFVASLLRMLEALTVGTYELYSGDTCRYTFITRQISAAASQSETSRTTVKHTVQTTKRVICHEHHIMDSVVHHVGNAPVDLPERVRQLLDECPSWLRPEIRLITGQMILEQTSVLLAEAKNWTLVEELPRTNFDPALILGPFVLAGWVDG